MEHLINQAVRQMQVSGIRKIANMVAKYPDVINLTLGQPDFTTPEHIKIAGKRAIDEDKTFYTHNAGLFELRKAASDYLYQKYQLSYHPDDEVIITTGASEAIDIAFRTILEEGCEVILPAPVYPGYGPLIQLCGAVPVYVDTSANGFKLNAEMIQNNLTEKTRCLVLPYPSNPVGSILDEKTLTEIADLLKDKEIFIVTDEIYSELTYGKKHTSIASFPEMRDKTIVINGLSKSHSMTGWRIGVTFAPAYLTAEMVKVHLYNATCASSISQYAAVEAFTRGIEDPIEMKKEYQARRDYVYDRLVSMGFEVDKPDGAFYMFPSIKQWNMKSFDFVTQLLEKRRVAVVPGDVFSEFGEGYIRIAYAYSMETLAEGCNRIEQFVQTLNMEKGGKGGCK
ncbi:aminotransferase A [Brevibacillus choshinensis]|uniref:aminotransferase A n=1 Tax=Brevibacillus choshinensis TaxID=54911 RepID=UPI002E1F09C7|nr:aminotransferase A [Brevibacillus choshinensis]MED4582584.1 aminotransferase A [Brevibacillus choshinensis]